MRSPLVLATLITLALGCTREASPQRRRRPATTIAATTTAATTAAAPTEAPSPPLGVPQRWTGEADSLETSAQQAGAIVVARLETLGPGAPGATNVSAFNATRWTVTRSLKGTLTGELTLQLSVQTLPVEQVEQVPRPGQSYVLFVGGGAAGATQIRKVMLGTPENLARVAPLGER